MKLPRVGTTKNIDEVDLLLVDGCVWVCAPRVALLIRCWGEACHRNKLQYMMTRI